MSFFKSPSAIFSSILVIILCFGLSNAAIFDNPKRLFVHIQFGWAAAVPGGGRKLEKGETWTPTVSPRDIKQGRIWARTNCTFDETGGGECETGDCGGLLHLPRLWSTTQHPRGILAEPGGCNNPCIVFKTDKYCYVSGINCGPTNLSKFFKDQCPNAFSYPFNDRNTTFTCPKGTNYRVVFYAPN